MGTTRPTSTEMYGMAVIEQHQISQLEAGWYPDPEGDHHLRYFNGVSWTAHVTHLGPTPCLGCAVHPVE